MGVRASNRTRYTTAHTTAHTVVYTIICTDLTVHAMAAILRRSHRFTVTQCLDFGVNTGNGVFTLPLDNYESWVPVGKIIDRLELINARRPPRLPR